MDNFILSHFNFIQLLPREELLPLLSPKDPHFLIVLPLEELVIVLPLEKLVMLLPLEKLAMLLPLEKPLEVPFLFPEELYLEELHLAMLLPLLPALEELLHFQHSIIL